VASTDPALERIRRLSAAAKRAQLAASDTLRNRDLAILEAAEGGYSHGMLAKAADLHRSRVEQIITNTAAARPAHDEGHDNGP
jgi:hypothetical protein